MISSHSAPPLITRLENYTLKFPQEVLLINAVIEGEDDTIVVFKGFSSSMVRSTAYDPEVPTLPNDAEVKSIDRLKGPYTPASPEYIEQKISLDAFIARLDDGGL